MDDVVDAIRPGVPYFLGALSWSTLAASGPRGTRGDAPFFEAAISPPPFGAAATEPSPSGPQPPTSAASSRKARAARLPRARGTTNSSIECCPSWKLVGTSGAAARPRASTPDPSCGEARGRRRIGSERGHGAAGNHPVTQTRFKRTERLERSDSSRGRMDNGKGRKAPRDFRGPARPFSPESGNEGFPSPSSHAMSGPNYSDCKRTIPKSILLQVL
jgi:hypothetical protein